MGIIVNGLYNIIVLKFKLGPNSEDDLYKAVFIFKENLNIRSFKVLPSGDDHQVEDSG